MKSVLLILFLSTPVLAQQQDFQIDPLEFSDCLPRWDRNIQKQKASRLPEIRHQLLQLIKYEKAKTERAKLLHRLAVNYYQQYEAKKDKKYLAESIKVMQKLIQDHPGYPKLDEAYLVFGEALWHGGRDMEALKVFKMFIKLYPKSPESTRAFIHFAEFLFKKQDYKRTLTMLTKAESFGPSEYSYCLSHRIAYCHHKLGDTQQAIEWLNKANELRSR
ncbi:tetratricopeptide repeat protein [Myxococcota bacterium]